MHLNQFFFFILKKAAPANETESELSPEPHVDEVPSEGGQITGAVPPPAGQHWYCKDIMTRYRQVGGGGGQTHRV